MLTESAIIRSSKFWGWEDIVPFRCSQTPVLYWWVVLHFMLSQPLRFEEVVVYTWAQDWHSYGTGMRFHHIHQLWWIGYSTHLYPAVLVTCAEKEICQFQVVGCIANYDDQIKSTMIGKVLWSYIMLFREEDVIALQWLNDDGCVMCCHKLL